MLNIFTDGACSGNPGPGGWAAVIIGGGRILELGGHEKKTTSNRMEMLAALEGIKRTPEDENAVLWTDSAYLLNGITKWIHNWKRSGWKKKDGTPVLNAELWREIDSANSSRIRWLKVAGHTGLYLNERCDRIAVAFSQSQHVELRNASLDKIEDRAEIEEAILRAQEASKNPEKKKSRSRPKRGGDVLDPREKYPKKVYLFVWNNEVHRFSDWPSCQAFASGKHGWTKACRSRREEEDYLKNRGLGFEALNQAINHFD